MTNSNLIVVDGTNFDATVNSGEIVLIDFWAEWCGPCKMFIPTLAEIAEDFKGKAIIGKVNVDENPTLAEKFGVMSIPTVCIFHKGTVLEKFVGARPKQLLTAILDKHIKEVTK